MEFNEDNFEMLLRKNQMYRRRIEELEIINAKFLQQLENVVDHSTINGMGVKEEYNASEIMTNITQDRRMSRSPGESAKKRNTSRQKGAKEEIIEVNIQNKELRQQIKGLKSKLSSQQEVAQLDQDAVFWKNNYEVKNQQFIELKKQYQQFNDFIRGQGDDTDPQKNYLIFENKQQSQEILLLTKNNHSLAEENNILKAQVLQSQHQEQPSYSQLNRSEKQSHIVTSQIKTFEKKARGTVNHSNSKPKGLNTPSKQIVNQNLSLISKDHKIMNNTLNQTDISATRQEPITQQDLRTSQAKALRQKATGGQSRTPNKNTSQKKVPRGK